MYSTIDSVSKKIDQKALIQLLNDEVRLDADIDLNSGLDPIVIRFNEAATTAQSEIDPYLRGRYTLPFSATPDLILSISDNFTIFHIYMRRYRDKMPDSILSSRKEQFKLLEQIQRGILDLGVADEPQNLKGEITTNKKASDRIFNPDMWDKF